jgi:hypothetical protein
MNEALLKDSSWSGAGSCWEQDKKRQGRIIIIPEMKIVFVIIY